MHETTYQWLTANGFDAAQLEQLGSHQDTALLLAARCGEEAVVADLLAAGANVHHRNMDGTTALWAACVADNEAIARRLLAHGSDIDNQNDNGATVLMYAASSGKLPWVRFLLEAGADERPQTLDGFSALELASTVEILRLLKGRQATRRAAGHGGEAKHG